MRLNGLGAPDETTLVPLNTVDAVVSEGFIASIAVITATITHSVAGSETNDTTTKTSTTNTNQADAPKPKCDACEKCTKPKTAGTELMWQMIQERRNENLLYQQIKSTKFPYPQHN